MNLLAEIPIRQHAGHFGQVLRFRWKSTGVSFPLALEPKEIVLIFKKGNGSFGFVCLWAIEALCRIAARGGLL